MRRRSTIQITCNTCGMHTRIGWQMETIRRVLKGSNIYRPPTLNHLVQTAVLPETFQHPKLLSALPSIDGSAEALSPIAKAGTLRFQCHVYVSTPLAQGSIASTSAVPSRKVCCGTMTKVRMAILKHRLLETYTAVLASLRVTLSAAKHLILAPSHSGVFALRWRQTLPQPSQSPVL